MAKIIKVRLNRGNQRPLKIIMRGKKSPASIEFRDRLAVNFGLQVIDLDNLLAAQIRNKTYFGNIIIELAQANRTIPTSLLIDVILERLERTDCQIGGFVLDISDSSFELLEKLDNMQILFHMAIVVDGATSEETLADDALNRLVFRKEFRVDTGRNLNDTINNIFFEITHFYDEAEPNA